MTHVADVHNLTELTYRLVTIPSVSYQEEAVADFVEDLLSRYSFLQIQRIDNNVVVTINRGANHKILLAGHLDTVPIAGIEPSLASGAVAGRGSVDMKGGLAVMIKLAAEAEDFPVDTAFIFYAKEEVKRLDSGLLEIERVAPELLKGDLAILLEPTNGHVELGCQGVMRVVLTMGGKSAHSARPWTGVNAIHRIAKVIERVSSFGRREILVDGLSYAESLQVVKVEGGTGKNVVPDKASAVISYRFAPNIDTDSAHAFLHETFSDILDDGFGDEVIIEEAAPSAKPHLSQAGIQHLVNLTGREPVAKLGWTDVAFFAERGIPGANFGPGNAELSHGPHEVVESKELDNCYANIRQFLFDLKTDH